MFKFENSKCYRMPVHFGGYDYQPAELYYHDVVNMVFTYKTDGDCLSEYIPECFEMLRPELTINYAQCREIDWMAGGGYNLIDVNVPVRFKGQRDKIEGNFSLVVWENKTAPILGGREETGVPKIFADIEDIHTFMDERFAVASFEGNTFLNLAMTVERPIDDTLLSQMQNSPVNGLNLRYIPKVGGPGAELLQPILYPQRLQAKQGWTGAGAVRWNLLQYGQNPSQAHIIKALTELPILEMFPAKLVKGVIVLMPSMARILE